MDNKKRQVITGLVLAALAVLITQLYVESETAQWKPKELVEVSVAREPIAAGTILSPALTKSKQVPKDLVPLTSIPTEQIEEYFGQKAAFDIIPGDYLLETSFVAPTVVSTSLSDQLGGKRAVTISVSEVSSLANSIKAGDLVDVIFSFNVEETGKPMTAVLFEAIPVIATGAYEGEAIEDDRGGYSTVTLKVSAEEALRIKYAERTGQIDLLLRDRSDETSTNLRPIVDISQVLAEEDAKRYDELTKAEPTKSPSELRDQIMKQLGSFEGARGGITPR